MDAKKTMWRGPVVGRAVFIRTVTMHYTGRVVAIDKHYLHLSEAAWIVDSGRFSLALSSGKLSEVEPYPGEGFVSVARGAIVDVCPWGWPLARSAQ